MNRCSLFARKHPNDVDCVQIMDGAPVRGESVPVPWVHQSSTLRQIAPFLYLIIYEIGRGVYLRSLRSARKIMDGAPVGGESVPAPWFNFEAD